LIFAHYKKLIDLRRETQIFIDYLCPRPAKAAKTVKQTPNAVFSGFWADSGRNQGEFCRFQKTVPKKSKKVLISAT